MSDDPLASPVAGAAVRPDAVIPHEHVVTLEIIERPPQDRPTWATIDGIAELLAGPARQVGSGVSGFDEFAWQLCAAWCMAWAEKFGWRAILERAANSRFSFPSNLPRTRPAKERIDEGNRQDSSGG